jgi:S-DNA-T family DNA segregation ATPase FtsK/SpoIIIE
MTTVRIVARLAYETARQMFCESPGDEGTDESEQPALRIKNLLKEEVEDLLRQWDSRSVADGLAAVQIVLAHDTDVVCDERFLAKQDRSITWYRNNNEHGLLYVQTKVESDESGLESMFTVQDRNYLDGSLDTDQFSPVERIVEIAWEEAGGSPALMPRVLVENLSSVRQILQSNGITISVRTFAAFALEAAKSLVERGNHAFDLGDVRSAVGLALPALGLLPDEESLADPQHARRLVINFRLADLMDPNGQVDQDPDELSKVIEKTEFVDEGGAPFASLELDSWRAACIEFVNERSEASRRRLPFWVYRQVFAKDTVSGALGDRVREEILGRDASRVAEFDDLDIQQRLNSREQEAARRIVEASPQTDAPPLIDLLRAQTQKVLRKLAYPRDRRFSNPFTQIVDFLRTFEADELAGTDLEVRCGRTEDDSQRNPSVGLFAFLFGRTLDDLAQQSQLDVSGVRLTLDPALLRVTQPPTVRSNSSRIDEDADDDGGDAPVEWDGVAIEMRLRRGTGDEAVLLDEATNLRWRPDDLVWLAFGWLMASAEGALSHLPIRDFPSGMFESLVNHATARLVPISDLISARTADIDTGDDSEIIARIIEARREFMALTALEGIDLGAIDRFVESWTDLLSEARAEFVPNGALDPRLQNLLSFDIIHSPNESRALMLWSHPLRLRWLRAYLLETAQICADALDGNLRLNSVNENFYLGVLDALSPHGRPPLLANSARTLMVPVAAHGFSEEFVAIKQEGVVTSTWKADLDDLALAEVSKQVDSYLRAHPHKADGISLVFVQPAGGTVPQRLVSAIRKREEWKTVPVQCLVIAPKLSWDALVAKFEDLETESRVSDGGRLCPPLQLELVDWQGESKAAEMLGSRQFDIAVVPNFFGDQVDVNEYSEPPIERSGSVHPLYDDSTYAERDAAPGSVSITLRPESPDPTMDDWSTVNVRLLRREAIAPSAPENVDYVKLNIRFEEAGELFEALHECCHWVVTLDRYIGRHQIESLPQRPDVLTVKESVGQSGLFTLVVSSNAGRKFVVHRLGRKLERISASIPNLDWQALATKVYDEIRVVAPGLILRSMGISRITEEVLGIMVAKRVTDRHIPPKSDAQIWISLDEHAEWFGGDGAVRADLCRIEIFRVGGRLQIGLVAVEGKLRKAYDPHGEQQAARSAQLLREALSTGDESGSPADALFWRHAILASLRESAGSAAQSSSEESVFDDVTRDEILSGQFDVAYCRALYSICIYDRKAPLSEGESNGVVVVQSSASEVLGLIEGSDELENPDSRPDERGDEAKEPQDSESRGSEAQQKDSSPEDPEAKPVEPRRGGMSEERLTQLYQKILDKLGEFGVDVRRPDDDKPAFIEGPAFVQFRVRPGKGVDPKRINACESALRVELALDEGKMLRFPIGGGTVNIEVPKEDSDRYFVTAEQLWERWVRPLEDALVVPIGVNQRDEIVAINFSSSNSPHLLIGGTTGSGKSEALNTILHGLTRYFSDDQLKLVLIDPKQTELQAFEDSPHLLGQIGYFDDDAITSLTRAVAEMNERYSSFRSRGARDLPQYNSIVPPEERLPWHLVVLDEYADLVSEPEARREIEGLVKRLSQKARACGIHLIIATQKPSAENISTTVRSNLPAQLALRSRSATESRIIIDEAGAETLNGKGDAFLKVADRIERVQCAKV